MISVKDFILRTDPIRVLTEAHEVSEWRRADPQLAFDDASERFRANPLTTEEVKECCADLRVLNKSDFKMLLKWRLDLLKAEKDYVKQLRREAADAKEAPEESSEEEEKPASEPAEEAPKDVSAELQEVRERVAVAMASGYEVVGEASRGAEGAEACGEGAEATTAGTGQDAGGELRRPGVFDPGLGSEECGVGGAR